MTYKLQPYRQTATGTNPQAAAADAARVRAGNVETLFVTSYNGKVITAVRQRKYDFSKARAGRGFGYDAVRTLVNKDKSRAKKIREALLKGYSIGQAKRRAAAA